MSVHVLDHIRQGGEFVLRAVDADGGDRGAFERGEEHAAEGIADGVPVTGLEGLGNKAGVGVSGGALVADGSLRHFETAETDWHVFLRISLERLRSMDDGVAVDGNPPMLQG